MTPTVTLIARHWEMSSWEDRNRSEQFKSNGKQNEKKNTANRAPSPSQIKTQQNQIKTNRSNTKGRKRPVPFGVDQRSADRSCGSFTVEVGSIPDFPQRKQQRGRRVRL